MWEKGKPRERGWYLCAWQMGDGFIYEVAKWTGTDWLTGMTAIPDTWKEIDPPTAQDIMLDELYKYAQ